MFLFGICVCRLHFVPLFCCIRIVFFAKFVHLDSVQLKNLDRLRRRVRTEYF